MFESSGPENITEFAECFECTTSSLSLNFSNCHSDEIVENKAYFIANLVIVILIGALANLITMLALPSVRLRWYIRYWRSQIKHPSPTKIRRTEILLTPREGFTKKSSCSFGFCPNEGGGESPAQIFRTLFTNCIYWVNLGRGREGGDPCPNLLARWR